MAQQNAVQMVEHRINPHHRVQDGFMEPSIQGLRGPRTRRLKSVLRIKTGPGFARDLEWRRIYL